ncbi:MAG: hypothetical protein ABSC46_03875 [Candidatus Limnocylindrales bacterium]
MAAAEARDLDRALNPILKILQLSARFGVSTGGNHDPREMRFDLIAMQRRYRVLHVSP